MNYFPHNHFPKSILCEPVKKQKIPTAYWLFFFFLFSRLYGATELLQQKLSANKKGVFSVFVSLCSSPPQPKACVSLFTSHILACHFHESHLDAYSLQAEQGGLFFFLMQSLFK